MQDKRFVLLSGSGWPLLKLLYTTCMPNSSGAHTFIFLLLLRHCSRLLRHITHTHARGKNELLVGTQGQTALHIIRDYYSIVRVTGRLESGMQVIDKEDCSYAKQHRDKELAVHIE